MASASSAPKLCATCGARYATEVLFCPNDGAPLQLAANAQAARQASDPGSDPYVGRELAAHIEVRQLAGVGSMGRVYRAFQKGIDRDVAVKILHRELGSNEQLVARFHREAKVASRLLHPNVVQIHLAGQLPDGALYIVMEYLDGLSLQSAFAAAGGAIPLPRALHIALQLCDAVGEAHAQGIVHRDLKPENVMLVHRGQDADFVKVLDFGIARLESAEQSMSTAAGLIFGTARYISPEGAQGEQVGPEGDVYAIATLVYQMLAGRTPFVGEQAVGILVQQIHDPPPPLRSIPRSSYVPEGIANVIMANLAKEKGKRAPDARSFGRALMDAAKVAGLSLEDVAPRGMMLGARASAVQLASMNRTRQLQLERPITEIAAPNELPPRMDASPQPPTTRTAYIAPSDPLAQSPQMVTMGLPNRQPPPTDAGPSAATQKWVPSPSVQAQMAAGVPSGVPSAPISSVDLTMDETTGQISPGRTSQPHTAPSGRLPPTAFDESMDDPPPVRAPSWRMPALVLLCFVLSVVVTGTIAYRMKLVGAASSSPSAAAVARAEDALRRQRFDNPPGDNVRDLTNDALVKWPADTAVLGVRARACEEIVKEATQRRLQGDLLGAIKLVKLARELDPTNATAQQMAAQYDAMAQTPAPMATVPAPMDAGRVMPSARGAGAAGGHKPPAAAQTAAPANVPASDTGAPSPPPPPAATAAPAPAAAPAPSASVKWM